MNDKDSLKWLSDKIDIYDAKMRRLKAIVNLWVSEAYYKTIVNKSEKKK
jgi:hypothetical protein